MKISPAMEGVMLGLGLIATLIGAAAITLAIPQFMDVLSQLGSNLPFFTILVVNCFWVVWLLPFVVIATWFAWPHRSVRSVAALCVGVGGPVLFFAICLVGLYLPIWQMGQVVGG